jgi:hypothetical protein
VQAEHPAQHQHRHDSDVPSHRMGPSLRGA